MGDAINLIVKMAGLDFDFKMNKEIVGAYDLFLILPESDSVLSHFPFDPVCFGSTAGGWDSNCDSIHLSQGKSVPQIQ